MAEKVQVARRKRSADDESEFEGLSAPPVAQAQTEQLQMPQAPEAATQPTNFARHEILDRVAHGGVSPLELQSMVHTQVFLTDEERSAFLSRSNSDVANQLGVPSLDFFSPTQQGPNPHGDPLGGPDALGFEGAKVPQGMMVPQGLLTVVGMVGYVKGLMGARSDMPQPGSGAPQPAAQNSNTSAQSATQDSSSQAPKYSPSASSPESHTDAGLKLPPVSNEVANARPRSDEPTAATQSSQIVGASAAGGAAFSSVQSAFEPMATEQSWLNRAMWGNSSSPFLEVAQKFFSLLRRLLGLERMDAPPQVKRGGH